MKEAKLHATWEENHASGIDKCFRVISVNVDGKRLVLLHLFSHDNRGTHYGETFEQCDLVQDREKRKNFLKRYRGKEYVSDALMEAILKVMPNSVARQSGPDDPEGVWEVLIDGHLRRIP